MLCEFMHLFSIIYLGDDMNDSIDFKLIGKRVREKRELLHVTQQAMADDLSISKYYISKIENGKVKVTLETLAEIANYLGTDISNLLSGSSPLNDNYSNTEILEVYHKATPEQKNMILKIAKTIVENK